MSEALSDLACEAGEFSGTAMVVRLTSVQCIAAERDQWRDKYMFQAAQLDTVKQERDALAAELVDAKAEIDELRAGVMIAEPVMVSHAGPARLEMFKDFLACAAIPEKRVSVVAERDALAAELKELQEQTQFDASDARFRNVFDTTLKQGSWPTERLGDSYRSPFSRMAWSVAAGTISRLKLYARPIPAHELMDENLEDMANSACQEALSFGVSVDPFLRLARTVRAKLKGEGE